MCPDVARVWRVNGSARLSHRFAAIHSDIPDATREVLMPQRLNAWRKGRSLGARALFVGAIFLVMSVGAVVADSHGTLGGVFHVPVIQASHSDGPHADSKGGSGKQDEGPSNGQNQN